MLYSYVLFSAVGTCDGQYIVSSDFSTRIAERVGANNTLFSVPITWDCGHLLNLAITDIRDGKNNYKLSGVFIKRLINRSNIFSQELSHGKGFATLQHVSASHNLTAHAPSTFAVQR